MIFTIQEANKRIKKRFFYETPVYVETINCHATHCSIGFSNGLCIVSLSVTSSLTEHLQSILGTLPSIEERVDHNFVYDEIALILALRREVSDLNIDSSYNLRLKLASGYDYIFETNIDYVDWAWAILNGTDIGLDPYRASSSFISNFNRNELEGNDEF